MSTTKEITKDITVEDKLRTLYDLQLIDSRIDRIKDLRGELPLEVDDLEAEVAGLTTRIENLNQELEDIQAQIKDRKSAIEEHKALMKKYTEQQKEVRNNREFNSLTKEIEFQELEIQLCEKHIREFEANLVRKKEIITETSEKLATKTEHLAHKKSELDAIMDETEKEEKMLRKRSRQYGNKMEPRLLLAYQKIRASVKNGLAVVSLERGAAEGSYFAIPPQTQMEIIARKKIITDEHSGRILVDNELAKEEKEKMRKVFARI